MSSLLIARDAYETALRTIGGKVQVSTHGGKFTQKELERYAKQSPHVVLTLLGFDTTDEAGVAEASAHWGVMCFTKGSDTPGTPRADSCAALAEAVVQVLLPVFAGEGLSGRATDLQARNVFSTPLDMIDIAMWSIEWNSALELVVPINPDVWGSVHATWDLQPREDGTEIFEAPEAEDEVEIENA